MIDFKELPADGNDFELLVRELLYNKGLEVYWSGKGADGGKDLLCIETHRSCFKSSTQRWLVQCKHNAHAGRAVNRTDLDSIIDSCAEHNATGYLLVCSTFPSSSLVKRLEEIQNTKGIITQFWDFRTLERELMNPENWGIANMFFPRSLSTSGWNINSIEPSFWYASFQGNVFYISTRVSANTDFCLPEIERRIQQIHELSLPSGHVVRLRAIYIDDKYCNYTMYLDYLIPVKEDESELHLETTVSQLEEGMVLDGIYYNFDIMTYRYNPYSDHFDEDSNSYYRSFLTEFKYGGSREGKRKYVYAHGHSSRQLTEETTNDAFDALVNAFRKVPNIQILNAVNAKIEFVDQFTENFDWRNHFSSANYHVDNFFDAQIRFVCDDFDGLVQLLNNFPNDLYNYFKLSKNYIFMPGDGLDAEEDSIFTLHFSVHPALITSKYQFRNALNDYLRKIEAVINSFLPQAD